MSLFANYKSFFSRAKTSSLMFLNSSYRILRPMGKRLNTYKPMIGEDLLILYLKAFAIRKALLLAI